MANTRLPLLIRVVLFVALSIGVIALDYRLNWLSGVRFGFSVISAPIYSMVNLPKSIIDWGKETFSGEETLTQRNDKLRIENFILKGKLQRYNELVFENQQLTKMLNAPYQVSDIVFLLARIVEVNQSRIVKQVVIDKGVLDKVFDSQVVIGELGIVGHVKRVGLLQSQVMLISDPTHHIPVKSERNGLRGIASGKAGVKHQMSLRFITNDADVKVGDIFISSNLGKKFPAGFPVAKVVSINRRPQQNFMAVNLVPIEKLNELDWLLLSTVEN